MFFLNQKNGVILFFMKRIIAIIAVLALSVSLSSCGGKSESNPFIVSKENCNEAIYDAERLINNSEYLETAPVGEFSSEEQQKLNSKRQYKEAMEIILDLKNVGCFSEDEINKAGDYLQNEIKSGGQ